MLPKWLNFVYLNERYRSLFPCLLTYKSFVFNKVDTKLYNKPHQQDLVIIYAGIGLHWHGHCLCSCFKSLVELFVFRVLVYVGVHFHSIKAGCMSVQVSIIGSRCIVLWCCSCVCHMRFNQVRCTRNLSCPRLDWMLKLSPYLANVSIGCSNPPQGEDWSIQSKHWILQDKFHVQLSMKRTSSFYNHR